MWVCGWGGSCSRHGVQHSNRLHVVCLRVQVHRLHRHQAEGTTAATLGVAAQRSDIARLGGGVAADVDQPAGATAAQVVDYQGGQARTGGIDDHDVGPGQPPCQLQPVQVALQGSRAWAGTRRVVRQTCTRTDASWAPLRLCLTQHAKLLEAASGAGNAL